MNSSPHSTHTRMRVFLPFPPIIPPGVGLAVAVKQLTSEELKRGQK